MVNWPWVFGLRLVACQVRYACQGVESQLGVQLGAQLEQVGFALGLGSGLDEVTIPKPPESGSFPADQAV